MKTLTIGRNSNNDVVIQNPYVSGLHCTITLEDNGAVLIRDMGSSNGTFVNGNRIQQAYLKPNDIVKIGDTIIPWQEYFSLSGAQALKTGIVRKLSIGRAPDNDIVISDDYVSAKHAELQFTQNNEVYILDTGSTNGTFVNDVRITFSPLLPGDRVRLGRTQFNWMQYLHYATKPSAPPEAKRKKIFIGIFAGIAILGLLTFAAWYFLPFLINNPEPALPDTLPTETNPMPRGNLAEMVKMIEKSVFLIKTQGRGKGMQGTGFFIDEYGTGVTNYHVIQHGTQWTIKTIDNREYKITEFIEKNKEYDYAVFRIDNEGETFPYLRRSKTTPRKGEEIFVLGNPQGIESTLTKGIVSGLRGGDENDLIRGKFSEGETFIQIDVAVSHGSSGSPVMNMQGEVVGIATLSFQEANCINCNFAVNIQLLAKYLKTF